MMQKATLMVKEVEGTARRAVEVESMHDGLGIRPEATGDLISQDGTGWPLIIEWLDGRPRLVVWADINSDEPTHEIDLSGALEANRRAEDTAAEALNEKQ